MQYIDPTSEEIRSAITTRSQNFMDFIVPFDELNCEVIENNISPAVDDGLISLPAGACVMPSVRFQYPLGTAQFSRHALNQLLARVQLSTHYWNRLNGWNAHELMVDNFNFCNETTANEISRQRRSNDPSYLFRLNSASAIAHRDADNEEDDDEEEIQLNLTTPVRAVLSRYYTTFDDSELFPMLMDQLDEEDNVSYSLYEYDDHITRLHIKLIDTEREYNNVTYSAGMVITNSEVGSSSIWVEPVVYRNGSIYANRNILGKQNLQMKIVHRGDIDRDRVLTMFEECGNIAQVGIVQLVEAFQQKIEPAHAVTLMQNIVDFPNRMALILGEEWEHEEDLKRADVAAAILDMAQTLPLFQKAKIEQAAGKIVGLFEDYSTRMNQILDDLNDEE